MREMSQQEIGEWASAYIEYFRDPDSRTPDDPLWWAVTNFEIGYGYGATDEDCWLAILEILSRAPPDRVIEVLAAGPLEDLIAKRGPLFIDRIENEASRNPEFRNLLGGVWQNSTPNDLWSRIERARGSKFW